MSMTEGFADLNRCERECVCEEEGEEEGGEMRERESLVQFL